MGALFRVQDFGSKRVFFAGIVGVDARMSTQAVVQHRWIPRFCRQVAEEDRRRAATLWVSGARARAQTGFGLGCPGEQVSFRVSDVVFVG